MHRKFSFHEFVGITAPGIVLTLAITQIFPDTDKMLDFKNLSLGGFGIVVIIAYVIGHLLQAVGNIFEKIWWWPFGGMPTNWVIKMKGSRFLNDEQLKMLPQKIANVLKLEIKPSLSDYSERNWFPISRQMYAALQQANAVERLEIFNGNYSFFRGVAIALIISVLLIIIDSGFLYWQSLILLALFTILAISRMHRFATYYARELFVQFLQLRE